MEHCAVALPNAGLGNRLFPWARCVQYAASMRVPMLAPRWYQFKIGPLLRGERDARTYHNLFRPSTGQVTGLRRILVEARSRRISEDAPNDAANDRTLRLFQGMEGYFGPIAERRELVRAALVAATRSVWLQRAGMPMLPGIGLHVRMGDFRPAVTQADFATKGALRTPLEWFISTLEALRETDPSLKAFVVSDGDDSALGPLLDLPGVMRAETGSALSDLLLLSRATALIGSGGSSFSAWAAFLGGMPVVTIGGQSLGWFGLPAAPGGGVHAASDRDEMAGYLAEAWPALRERPCANTWWRSQVPARTQASTGRVR